MFGMKVRREIKIKFVTLRPKDEKNFINTLNPQVNVNNNVEKSVKLML